MGKRKVVPLPKRHRDMPRGDGMYAATYQFGNTTVHIDDSYLKNRTPEQERMDKEALNDAMWLIADELQVRGETA